MEVDRLKAYLVELPSKLDFKNPGLAQNVQRALYYAVSDEGRLLPELFPKITDDECKSLDNYSRPVSKAQIKSPFTHSSKKHSHAPNKVCSRAVKKGEPIYTCKQCGLDSTCVLCIYCFNREDHINHEVSVRISQGEAYCDCGDLEAFTKLNCKCIMEPFDPNVPNQFTEPTRKTVQVCLDYILDVMNYSVTALPFVHKNVNKQGQFITSKTISDYSSLPSEHYGGAKDPNSPNMWYLILWNDEHHNITEAISAITSATGVSSVRAGEISKEISAQGRVVLEEALHYDELLDTQERAEVNGLVLTIVSARDYMREMVVLHIFTWLLEIIEFPDNTHFREVARLQLCNLLLEPNFKFSNSFPTQLLSGFSVNLDRKLYENGILNNIGKFVNLGVTSVDPLIITRDLNSPVHLILVPKESLDSIDNSRIQFLLAFQTRFTRFIRQKLTKALILPILSDLNQKAVFTEQYMAVYPNLLTAMAFSDREDHLNILSEVAVQVFTCKASLISILQRNEIGNILGPLARLIEENSTKMNFESGYPNFIDIANKKPQSYLSIKRSILRGIQDFKRLTEPEYTGDHASKFLSKDNLTMLLLFLRNFQGYWPMVRKYGNHVENESFDFVVHLEYSFNILSAVKSIAATKVDDIKPVISLIVDFLLLRNIKQNAPGIADFQVSKEPVGLVNVINSFLSHLIQYYGIDACHPVLSQISTSFMNISDISLRSIVLGSQIKIGFWIRNGISASRQGSLYFDSSMSDSTFFRDFHLNQIASCYDNPITTLFNFLDRWELLSWYSNETSHEKTIYEDRFSTIAEKFIVFMFNLITNRTAFVHTTQELILFTQARRQIEYALCDEPKSFSQVKALVGTGVVEMVEFEEILNEVADYRAPTGLVDTGLYILKPSVYETLDPLSLYLDASKFQVVSESLVKNIAKSRGVKEEEIVLLPKISDCDLDFVKENLGRFTKTKDFAKLIYKFLRVAIDTSDESYLAQLLHLLHAVLLDDESLYGKDYLCEHFVTISIGDLLLTIAESSMSKSITNKADFLVELLVAKDNRIVENLVDSFGEEHVQEYKKSKVSLFESGTEKKNRMNEKRKLKVMKRFAKQREKFLSSNKELEDLANDEDEEAGDALRTCVYCGEKETTSDPFGVLATLTNSSTFWKIPMDDPVYSEMAFKPYDEQETPAKWKSLYGRGYKYDSADNKHVTAQVITTCGHGMHFACFNSRLRSSTRIKHVPCPLCHNLHDIFVPSCIAPETGEGLTQDKLRRIPIHLKYNQISNSSSTFKSGDLLNAFVHGNYQLQRSLRKVGVVVINEVVELVRTHYLSGSNKNESFFNRLMSLSILIADTIRMNEIGTRIDGEESLGDFLTKIPGSTKTLLKALIQCRALVFELRSSSLLLSSNYDLSFEFQEFWNSTTMVDGPFNEIVLLFFQTNESFTTLVTVGMTKLFTIAAVSLLKHVRSDPQNQKIFSTRPGIIIPDEIKAGLYQILQNIKETMNFTRVNITENLIELLYFSIERVLLPFLRQSCVFLDIMTCKSTAENQHESIKQLADLKTAVNNQAYVDCSDALTSVLGVKSLGSLILDVSEQLGGAHTYTDFHFNIYDVVLNARIPKFMSTGILALDYPAVVKLIDLPEDYNDCVIDSDNFSVQGNFDTIVCLHCAAKVKNTRFLLHLANCSTHTGIFYVPRLNNLKIVIHIGQNPINVDIPAPYLTVHGEYKRAHTDGKATLHAFRYKALNELWLYQTLNGFVTRRIFGSQVEAWNINDQDHDILEDEELVDSDAPNIWP